MSTKISITIHVASDVEQLRSRIVEHVIIFSPPYEEAILSILQPYRSAHGRRIDVIVHHGTKDVSIIDHSIRHHVIRTAILSFQNHRISYLPTTPFPHLEQRRRLASVNHRRRQHMASARRVARSRQPDRSTDKTCSICFDTIMESNMQMLPCAHGFHEHCIQRWFLQNNTCPVCRHPLT